MKCQQIYQRLLVEIAEIRIVVGYEAQKVIDRVKKIRADAVFVFNYDYKTTSNSYSIHLATKDLDTSFIILDGDLIIKKDDFKKFLNCKDRLDLPPATLKKLVQGVIWREEHFNGTTLTAIAKANDCSWAYVSNCIDFSFSF